ncbi:HAMP domain-containing sensor histidine kinase [Synechococcus sp. PCC 7336]|uniref:sensor histidine kinase n=1 Tax=Synechococcus sp. PCC 7336 TaxID=195250 RepID=UPI000348EBA8|nr:HAMP domain-containing sensor histidine kinase [Synechococcus sp. PCC 7336]
MSNVPSTETDRVETLLHQLRNPLTALTTFAKLLEKRSQPDDPDGWIVDRIQQECQHLRSLLDDFEAKEATAVSAEAVAEIDVNEFLQGLWPTYQTLAVDCGVEAIADWNSSSADLKLIANALALRQVLDNLMDNAFKYTPAGGRVSLTARADGDKIALTVSDTGSGIAQADLEQVFDRYYRGDEHQPGHGLGLAIARQLVWQMGGEISASSQVGGGTEFSVRLPRSGGDRRG